MKKLWMKFWSVINNERGEVITPPEEPVEPPTPAPVEPKVDKTEALRELSKELGINAFDPKEIKSKFDEFNKWQESQKTEQQKLQEQLSTYETEKAAWTKQRLEYESKLAASKLNIADEYLEDALKLAGDPTKLADVVKKYPIFVKKGGINIGVQEPGGFQNPNDNTEVEAYMAQNYRGKKYEKYLKK